MAFRALSLHSARVDGVSSTSAFHYSFSPSPPPISPVTSNTIVVVLWRRTPLTARKLLDHRGTSSWRQHCAVIPSMQSRTAASTSLAVWRAPDDLALEFEGLCRTPPCAQRWSGARQLLMFLPWVCQIIFFFFICRLIYSRHPISLGNELLLTWNWRVNDGFFQSSLLILVQRSVKETRGKWILCKLVSVHGRSSLEITGRFLTTPPAILNQGGTSTRPTPPRDFWRMNQGNVAPWFSEQAVTWNTARSDFLPVRPPAPSQFHSPLGTRLNVKEALNWTQIDPLRKKLLKEDSTGF